VCAGPSGRHWLSARPGGDRSSPPMPWYELRDRPMMEPGWPTLRLMLDHALLADYVPFVVMLFSLCVIGRAEVPGLPALEAEAGANPLAPASVKTAAGAVHVLCILGAVRSGTSVRPR